MALVTTSSWKCVRWDCRVGSEMNEHRPRNVGTEPPNPLDFRAKDPLREVYQGRWKHLPSTQKVGLVVMLGVWVVFVATVGFAAGRAHSLGSLVPVVVLASVLGLLLLVLRKKAR